MGGGGSQFTFSTQPLGEVSECLPLCGVHVDVFSVADVFIVDDVVVHSLGPCRRQKSKNRKTVFMSDSKQLLFF